MTGENDVPASDPQLVTEVEDIAQDDPTPAARPRRSLLYRAQRYAYRKFPSIVPDPGRAELLEECRKHDDEDNAQSEPPEDEAIDLKCMWGVEFYTPSQIGELLRRFEKLGWNRDDPSSLDRNPVTWLRSFRESTHGTAWFNLGPLHREGDPGFFHHGRAAPLPPGVEYALATMYSLTPSISCIVVGFILDETQGRRFEVALRRKRKTLLNPVKGGGYRIPGPVHQKEDDVRTIRAELRSMVAEWFRTNLPGLFAGDALAGEFPTCELTTLLKTQPCPADRQAQRDAHWWLGLLDIDHDFRAWKAERIPGLKFQWPLMRDKENRFHSVLTCREDAIPDKTFEMYGERRRSTFALHIDRMVNSLLSRWGLLGLLAAYEKHLNTTRDTATFESGHYKKPLALLEALRGHVALSVDVSATAGDLKRLSEDKRTFGHDVPDFRPCHPSHYINEDITLEEALRDQITERADWLRDFDRSVRDLLIQYGTTLGTHENIKIQRRMSLLTWAIVALTVLIAILTAVTTTVSVNGGSLAWPW